MTLDQRIAAGLNFSYNLQAPTNKAATLGKRPAPANAPSSDTLPIQIHGSNTGRYGRFHRETSRGQSKSKERGGSNQFTRNAYRNSQTFDGGELTNVSSELTTQKNNFTLPSYMRPSSSRQPNEAIYDTYDLKPSSSMARAVDDNTITLGMVSSNENIDVQKRI